MFFVISGFLITQDIANRIEAGKFSIIEFYIRRVRRIFPALFVTLIFTSVFAYFILYPEELVRYGKSLAGAALSISNIVFYRRDNYFGANSAEEPLLHTWSLGVEEQFYIFWPILLFIASRFLGRKGVIASLILVAGASLYWSQAVLATNPSFSYFMLPTRAWELALGGILGLAGKGRLELGKLTATAIFLIGSLLLGYAFFNYSELTPFPGFSALIPVVGTSLILYAGQFGNPCSGILAGGLMTFIGRLSYPLYLVHWPIIVFWGLASPVEPGIVVITGQLLLMLLSSYAIVTLVEPSIRRRSATLANLRFWVPFAAFSITLVLTCSFFLIKTHGFPARHDMPEWIVQSKQEVQIFQGHPCMVRGDLLPQSGVCTIGDPDSSPTLVLWGDSHAAQLIPAFRALVEAEGYSGMILTKAGCPPIPDVEMLPSNEMRSACRQFNTNVLERLHEIPSLRAVIVAGKWSSYVSGKGLLKEDGAKESFDNSLQLLSRRLTESAELVRGLGGTPVVATVAPVGSGTTYNCYVRSTYLGKDSSLCGAGAFSENREDNEMFKTLLPDETLASRLDLISVLCQQDEGCDLFDGEYGLIDNVHISETSAMKLVPELKRLVGQQ
ncbi:peptidoglycan/LPS O-acetylase OafA/YrhL [Martelella radicis]|uniref:Peptidoglycan/LPS O-acetylase OafA/YrhL n=1 Tax=Martelella radicis TaxID=1397476 RepID=A0A7W6KKS0_9HYPH|nr:peptidoglycan/LPS O-acetylase OafA/YrhL [Martelella radicis]